uniref:Uncharacterized protein n=1 Tax=Rhizophora mucronata TaxID=61149 RepID=A0A2P2NX98_RHIMU
MQSADYETFFFFSIDINVNSLGSAVMLKKLINCYWVNLTFTQIYNNFLKAF